MTTTQGAPADPALVALPSPAAHLAEESGRLIELEKARAQNLEEGQRIRTEIQRCKAAIIQFARDAHEQKDNPILPFDQAARNAADQLLPPDAEPTVESAPAEIEAQAPAARAMHRALPVLDRPGPEDNPNSPNRPPESVALEDLDDAPKIEALEQALRGCKVMPRAPELSEDDCGVIGTPLMYGNDYWAVVQARNYTEAGKPMVAYTLHPLHDLEEWGESVCTWHKRWNESGNGPPEDVPLKGVQVLDPDGQDWVMGFDSERVELATVRQPAVQLPPAPAGVFGLPFAFDDFALPAGRSLADAVFEYQWYESQRAQHPGAPPMNRERLRTVLECSAEMKHLMLDPAVNDYGVVTKPERLTFQAGKGFSASVKLHRDLDGRWWASHEYGFNSGGLGGRNSPTMIPRAEDQRYADKLDAADYELNELEETLGKRLKPPYHTTDGEKAALRAALKAVQATRAGLRKKLAESQQPNGKGQKPKRSIANGVSRDSPAAWFQHFDHTYFNLAGKHAPKPEADDRVGALYERYQPGEDNSLAPGDAARQYYRVTHPAQAADRPQRKLGQYVAGVKGALPKDLHGRVSYDKRNQTAAPAVMEHWKKGTPAREAAASLVKRWAK